MVTATEDAKAWQGHLCDKRLESCPPPSVPQEMAGQRAGLLVEVGNRVGGDVAQLAPVCRTVVQGQPGLLGGQYLIAQEAGEEKD